MACTVRRGLTRAASGFALLAVTAALVACGDDDSGSTASTSSGNTADNACVSRVADLVAEDKKPMEPLLPEASFDMSKNQGKKIWFISPSQATGYALALSKAVTEAAKAAGMSATVFDGKNQPDRFVSGFTQAVRDGAAGIILYAVNPKLVPEGLKRAKDAGIPVVTMATGVPTPPDSGIVEEIDHDREAEGRMMANYAAYLTDCKVNGAITLDSTYIGLVTERDAIEAQLKELCPDTCTVQDHDAKLATMATDLAPSTQTLIQRNPDLNILFATFDQLATYQIPAVERSRSDVKIVGTNGLPENLKAVKQGSPQVADVAYVPPEFFGWLGVDQLGRAMAGEPVGDENGDPLQTPVQTFDQENLPDDTTDFDAVYPGLVGYQDKFKEKWGMQ